MSILDMDENLIEIMDRADLVYSPLVDFKEFPDGVDVAFIEGGVGSEEDKIQLELIRGKTRILVSYGDCAVTGNVPTYRNRFSVDDVISRSYIENVSSPEGTAKRTPGDAVPRLLPSERPLHEHVAVDFFLPGCPPRPGLTYFVLKELLEGRMPDVTKKTRFGL